MSNYNKIGITRPSAGLTHPFKIDIAKDGKKGDGTPQYTLSVNYHSRLFTGMTLNEKYLSYKKVNIVGLDYPQKVPSSFPGKNYYCVLNIKIKDLQVSTENEAAKIIWVEDDKSVEKLNPVVFESSQNLRQTEARIIIGTFVSDDEAIAGLPAGESAVNTAYIMQFINTNLLMCSMVFNGVSVLYPVPFGGGRLNF